MIVSNQQSNSKTIIGCLRNCAMWKDIKSIISLLVISCYNCLKSRMKRGHTAYEQTRWLNVTSRNRTIDYKARKVFKLVTVHRTAMWCRQRESERGLVYTTEVNNRPFKYIGPINYPVAYYPYSNQFCRCRLGECVIIELNGLWWLVQNGPCEQLNAAPTVLVMLMVQFVARQVGLNCKNHHYLLKYGEYFGRPWT